MSEDQADPQQQTEAPPVVTKDVEASPPKPQPQLPDPRRRLRELLAIPERDRTDAVWDELVELEIQTGPGNRAASPQANPGQRQEQGRRPEQQQGRRQDQSSGKRPGNNRFVQKRRRGPGKPA